ncbi:MAG: hypothetical protein PT977_03140 [Acidobacteriota bacterium]|nr:hypothetical protein [Acidobacteriota bacterium]
MFRTARAFLLAVPGAFLLVLSAYLVVHPRAAESFAAYPILADALGVALTKRPLVRFIAASTLFFLPPYLMAGLLLFFADVGVSAAAPLWARGRVRRADPSLPPESRWSFLAVTALAALAFGVSLHRVAHGGDLPGGINVGPLLVALAAFAAVAAGLFAGGIAAGPRALIGWFRQRARAVENEPGRNST